MRVAPFFALTIAFTFALQLPAVLAKLGLIDTPLEALFPLAGLGGFGPLVAAIVLTWRAPNERVASLFSGLRPRASNLGWYGLAIVASGALLAVGSVVFELFGAWGDRPRVYPPEVAQHVVAALLVPLVEEIGWRGYALPRMQRDGRLRAALVLGLVWAVWHVPMFVLSGFSVAAIALGVPFFVAGSVAFSWLYNRSGQHLLTVVLAHVGAHLSNAHRTMPDDPQPYVVATVMWCVVAVALVGFDRRAWVPVARSPRIG